MVHQKITKNEKQQKLFFKNWCRLCHSISCFSDDFGRLDLGALAEYDLKNALNWIFLNFLNNGQYLLQYSE
jgi:hypothetical protein